MNIYPAVFRTLRPLAEKSTIAVERRVEVVGDDGVLRLQVDTYQDIVAIVVDMPPNSLDRQADYQKADSTIEVSTNFPLYGPSQVEERNNTSTRYQPDQLTWHGSTYLVVSVLDLSKRGRGFVKAVCSSVKKIDPPPMEEV